jgi:hypothetical protein
MGVEDMQRRRYVGGRDSIFGAATRSCHRILATLLCVGTGPATRQSAALTGRRWQGAGLPHSPAPARSRAPGHLARCRWPHACEHWSSIHQRAGLQRPGRRASPMRRCGPRPGRHQVGPLGCRMRRARGLARQAGNIVFIGLLTGPDLGRAAFGGAQKQTVSYVATCMASVPATCMANIGQLTDVEPVSRVERVRSPLTWNA